ncbi:tryptophan halogenase family protein [Brevirhabdus sp.]|uniref:tryptophan halogenase family protein n=1 Tax=Brevirhabdus sp. TaxID=2004514 RepID=UPI004059B6EE
MPFPHNARDDAAALRVLIVGGGSAGWIAAATLHFALNGADAGARRVAIRVLESPETPRIGVGEATIPTIRDMFARFGLSEAAVMRRCKASFKHAIRFDDWSGPGSRYYHPFQRHLTAEAHTAAARWLAGDGTPAFAELVSSQPALIAGNRAPRAPGQRDYAAPVPYAYHLDAEALAEMLAEHCRTQGVGRLSGHVVGVNRRADGTVAAVRLRDGTECAADLFVDCTGFRALLAEHPVPRPREGIAAAAPADWIDQSHHLICDRAVTLRIPEGGEGRAAYRPAPFTRARALSAGWAWNIGLTDRRGRGYVYSSTHCDRDRAEACLRADEGPRANGLEAGHLRFRVGRRRSPWQGNTVAIGLAAGFLEPLESTGIFMADHGARALLHMFPPDARACAAPALARRYNALMTEMHDELLDFIAVHYAVAGRRDTPFWRDAGDPARLTDRLRDLLALWDHRPPAFVDFSNRFVPFNHANYEFILLGSGWRPRGAPPGPRPAPIAPEAAGVTRDLLHMLPPLS